VITVFAWCFSSRKMRLGTIIWDSRHSLAPINFVVWQKQIWIYSKSTRKSLSPVFKMLSMVLSHNEINRSQRMTWIPDSVAHLRQSRVPGITQISNHKYHQHLLFLETKLLASETITNPGSFDYNFHPMNN
jgi:hypothetical protein